MSKPVRGTWVLIGCPPGHEIMRDKRWACVFARQVLRSMAQVPGREYIIMREEQWDETDD